jgi:putative DNA primase/helicase
MLLRWGLDAMPELRRTEINLPNLGNDRMTDNWIPLATIAYALYEVWFDRAVEAMKELSGYHVDADDSVSIMILEDICNIFAEQQSDKIFTDDLLHKLVAMDDRPWPEWKNGKPLSKPGLAKLLRPFNIKSKQIRIGLDTKKGYLLEDFQESFSRYTPPVQSETPKQQRNNSHLEQIQSETQKDNVSDENSPKPLKLPTCFDVSDKNTSAGQRDKKEVLI